MEAKILILRTLAKLLLRKYVFNDFKNNVSNGAITKLYPKPCKWKDRQQENTSESLKWWRTINFLFQKKKKSKFLQNYPTLILFLSFGEGKEHETWTQALPFTEFMVFLTLSISFFILHNGYVILDTNGLTHCLMLSVNSSSLPNISENISPRSIRSIISQSFPEKCSFKARRPALGPSSGPKDPSPSTTCKASKEQLWPWKS